LLPVILVLFVCVFVTVSQKMHKSWSLKCSEIQRDLCCVSLRFSIYLLFTYAMNARFDLLTASWLLLFI